MCFFIIFIRLWTFDFLNKTFMKIKQNTLNNNIISHNYICLKSWQSRLASPTLRTVSMTLRLKRNWKLNFISYRVICHFIGCLPPAPRKQKFPSGCHVSPGVRSRKKVIFRLNRIWNQSEPLWVTYFLGLLRIIFVQNDTEVFLLIGLTRIS